MKHLLISTFVLAATTAHGAAWAGKPAPVDVKATVFLAKKGSFEEVATVAPKAPVESPPKTTQLDQHPDKASGFLMMVKLDGTGTGLLYTRVKQGKKTLRIFRKRVSIDGLTFVPVWVDTSNYCKTITIDARVGKARVVRELRLACAE